MTSALDLDQYFQRVAYRGLRKPNLATLHALTAAHSMTIPFENVDVLLGRRIRLAPEALFHKLVEERRGGYCFEQNGLFLAVLRQLGFDVQPLAARVRLNTPDRNTIVAQTHVLLQVRVAGQSWLTDVGVGGASLTCALRWQAGLEQATPHENRRLVQANGRWYHQMLRHGHWQDVYEFTGVSMPLVDREVASWYVSTHPESGFRKRLMVARALPGGRRVGITGNVLTRHAADESTATETLNDANEFEARLRHDFGLECTEEVFGYLATLRDS